MSRPSLRTITRRALAAGGEAAVPRGTTVLLAVSGGPDSMALLDVCARLRGELGLRVVAHGVDHGLRAEAADELDGAEAHAASLGVPFGRTNVRVAPGGNLQARAREARHRALRDAARSVDACAVATAHHADDRAETFLLRLLRGAGARGLGVMPPRAPLPVRDGSALEVLRPLLRARRNDVLAYVRRHGIPCAADPSNENPRFDRVRVRTTLLPLLESFDARVVDHLNQLADELERHGRGETLGLPRATEVALARLLRASPSAAEMSQAEVWLPGGLTVRRASDMERAERGGRGGRGGRDKESTRPSAPALGASYSTDVGRIQELGRIRSSLGGIQRSSLKVPRSS